MRAGKHVQTMNPHRGIHSPDSARHRKVSRKPESFCMAGIPPVQSHPSYIHKKSKAGRTEVQQMMFQQTLFSRAQILNAAGKPRAGPIIFFGTRFHIRGIFQYQTGSWFRMVTASGPLITRSGNRHGQGNRLAVPSGRFPLALLQQQRPSGTFFRYLCDHGNFYRAIRRPADGGRQNRMCPGDRVDETGSVAGPENFAPRPRSASPPNAKRQPSASPPWTFWTPI